MPGQPPRRDTPRTLLQRHLLIIPIHRLLGIHRERSSTFAVGAKGDFHLLGRILEKRTERGPTLAAVEFDILQLGKHPGPPRHHPRDPDETVQVALPQIPQGQAGRQFGDPDVDLGMDPFVRRVIEEDGFERDVVKDL